MIKMLLTLKLFLVLVIFSPATLATAYQGKVTNVFAWNGKIFVHFTEGGTADYCSQSLDRYIAWIDPESEYGKTMITLAISAKLSGRLVWVAGNGSCISAGSGRYAEVLTAIDLKG
jgi:hypothetical protein